MSVRRLDRCTRTFFIYRCPLFRFLYLCVCPQTGQVHLYLFLNPLCILPVFYFFRVCLSADWTGAFAPPFICLGSVSCLTNSFRVFGFPGVSVRRLDRCTRPPLFWFVCAFCSSVSRVPVQPRFSITVLVCLSADWTGAFVPFFFACNTKAVFSTVLVCLSTDVTGSPVPFTHYYQGIFLLYSCVCPQTGQVHLYSLYCTPTVFHSPNLVWHH